MNRKKKLTCVGGLLIMATVCILFPDANALAGENPTEWRPIYDIVMRWVNFLILAFVIVKFGKAPLMNFLRGRQEAHEKEIRQLEKEKEEAMIKAKETQEMLTESNERFKVITERIIAQGEKKKQKILNTGKSFLFQGFDHRVTHIGAFRDGMNDSPVEDIISELFGNFSGNGFSPAPGFHAQCNYGKQQRRFRCSFFLSFFPPVHLFLDKLIDNKLFLFHFL